MAVAGADVRYIITGDREGPMQDVLSTNERYLIARYRGSPQSLKDAALRVLLGEDQSNAGKVIIHGRVGAQVEKIEGGVKIDMGSKK